MSCTLPWPKAERRKRHTSAASSVLRFLLSALWIASAPSFPTPAADAAGIEDPGFPSAYAIKGARLVVAPGDVVEDGTLVVREGRVEAAGPAKDVAIPFDAEVVEGKGLIVYPGFIDLYTTAGQRAGVERSATGRGAPVELSEPTVAETQADNRKGLTPEFEAASALDLNDGFADPRRRLGFTDLLSAPSGAIATGQSAFVSLSGEPRREALIKSPVALHIHLAPPTDPSSSPGGSPTPGRRRGPTRGTGAAETPYPRVLMGSIAHLRQAMSDAEHHHRLLEYEKAGGAVRAGFDPTLDALWKARTKEFPVWWQADSRDEIHRALDLAREFGVSSVIVGGREAYKVVDRLKAENVPVVLRLAFPEEPKVPTEEEYRKRPEIERDEPLKVLADRREVWKSQVGSAAALAKAGVPFALGTEGVEKLDTVPAQVRSLIAAGLTADQALDGLTRGAAAIAGLQDRLGTLEAGKLAHVVVFTAPFEDAKAKVKLLFIDGRKFEVKPPEPGAGPGGGRAGGRRGRPGEGPDEPSGEDKPEAEKKDEPGKPTPDSAPSTKPDEPKKPDSEKKPETPKKPGTEKKPEGEAKKEGVKPEPFRDLATEFDADRKPTTRTNGTVLIKDAVILTVTKGTLPKGSILIENGKIKEIGPDVKAAPEVPVIDAAGLVAMPGIIDTHSHIAVDGGVNEVSLSVVPEVRIKDVVTGDDVSIFRAAAGGTTTARVLHGSANTIGGQDAVIKMKYGLPGRDLILKEGPQGVKFALGENVTRVPGRFPNTRMGVELVITRAFEEARAYQAAWKAYEDKVAKLGVDKAGPPPRRDFRLEALKRMLEGSIKVHSHCYRADEIIMLLRTAEKFGIRVQSLQHVLEGYKVAAEIAAHGASGSTFSDWWAYKVEAFDAIPFNAVLMSRAGVNVCINSDSEELIRHLNVEAAKMVKYGGATEEQALAMVTINPARELGRDDRIGSLEVGKDGDVALFNGHPFDAFARCELTLIDGEVYFQRPRGDAKFAVRAGDHSRMPQPAEPVRGRKPEFTAQPKQQFALVGATLHPVSGPRIENGVLVVSGGKIASVGAAGTAVPPEAQTLDVKGLDVWPGMIDAGTDLGLNEIGSLRETHDAADAALYQPELLTSTALRADSEHIPVTRANGVLSALVQPNGGVISGQASLINLRGWVPREMVVRDPAGLLVQIPGYAIPRPGPTAPATGPGSPASRRAERKKQIDELKEEFRQAIRYAEVVAKAREKGEPGPKRDPRLDALAPYARGEKPVVLRAENQVEILDAIEFAREMKLKAVLSGASEAWKVVDAIKKSGMPVIVGGTLHMSFREYDPYDAAFTNPLRLHEAGIPFAIRSKDGGFSPASNGRNLPYEAAAAVAVGLPADVALKSVTLASAQILGVADQLGSLEAGKRANLVITAGDILQPTTEVVGLFIDGKPFTPESRHTRLFAEYSRRLDEVRAGTALLGLERPAGKTAAVSGSGDEPSKRAD